ncbi:hypothetical protein ABK040_015684 [Willaertia magna]
MSTTTNDVTTTTANLPTDVDIKKYQIIYPVYIDKTKTIGDGRRIPKSKCIENPTAAEIADICAFLKIPYVLEREKRHPHDPFVFGRVRVLLKKDHESQVEDAKSKHQFLIKVASLIPRLESRLKKQETTTTTEKTKGTSSPATTTSSTSTASSKGGKGGGNKKTSGKGGKKHR